MNELEIIIREDTNEGYLFYQQDPEVEQYLIYLSSPNFTIATHRVELEDPVLFRLNANRILSAVKIVIPRHAWQITQSIPVPVTTVTASLEFPVTTIQQHAFNLEANIVTATAYTHALVTFGQPEVATFWVALSSQCWALIAENRLKGFFMILE
ncbi:MAG: hypothetical protein AAGF95_17465 [Chloroflexota bacterium]